MVEARERSGALITADFALEEGRDVLAVPGEITSSLSAGTNALLRLGATPVTCAADVLEGFGMELVKTEAASLGNVADALLHQSARARSRPTSSSVPRESKQRRVSRRSSSSSWRDG